jgi:ABC-type transport system involved in multi-copper enzyme maturation permease subunit
VRAILVDLRKTALAPAAIATLVVAVLLSVLLSVPGQVPFQGFSSSQFAVAYEYDHGFVFHFFVFNDSGRPIAGARTNVTLMHGNSSDVRPITVESTTGPDGFATVTVPVNDSNSSVTIDVLSAVSETISGASVSAVAPGVIVPGPGTFSHIDAGRYGLTPEVLLFDPGPGGSVPTDSTVAVSANYSGPPANSSGPGGRDVLLSSAPVRQIVSTYQLSGSALPLSASRIDFTLLGPNGSLINRWSESPSDLAVLPYTATSWGGLLSDRVALWGFLGPLLAVGFGYAAYARPRGSRSLEPVLALPTTRLGVLGRRYVSAFVPLAVGTGVAVLVEFQLEGPLSTGLSPVLITAIWGSLLLEAAAFLGIVFLLSHLFRSAAAVAGLGVGLAAFLAFFVNDVVRLLALLSGQEVTGYQLDREVIWNPTYLPTAAVAQYFAGFGSPGIPSQVLPPPSEVVGVVVGITAAIAGGTLLLAAWLARHRD